MADHQRHATQSSCDKLCSAETLGTIYVEVRVPPSLRNANETFASPVAAFYDATHADESIRRMEIFD